MPSVREDSVAKPATPTADPRVAVAAAGLGKRFGRHWALAHVDLTLRPGEVVLLAGANGSGKTTLLRLIAGLHKPSAGTLEVFGKEVMNQRLACRRELTLVGHDDFLYDRLTPLETLRVWDRLAAPRPARDDLRHLLAEVGLAEHADSPVAGFSAGMRKRLTLVRTRLERPRLLLLDEPFSALDAAGRRLIESWVAGARQAGQTVVMASHELARAAALADRAVFLEQGQVRWSGAAGELPNRVEAEP